MLYINAQAVVIADSTSCEPLPRASVFAKNGSFLCVSSIKGTLPYISASDFPITIRYIGFKERTVSAAMPDTIFLQENPIDLTEVIVTSKAQKALHLLAYVREYSTLSTYTDTIFMFREKTVDYMIPTTSKSNFRGWLNPRILCSKSYYRFTNQEGLDSISDAGNQHFSWSDWIGIKPEVILPQHIVDNEFSTDTVYGRYSPAETWVRKGDKLRIDLNILADTTCRKWVPNLLTFFRRNLDYERFNMQINYDNVDGQTVSPLELTGYSFNIESNGRGRDMFMFNKIDQDIYVTTYAEVYIIDRELITIAEAKKWAKRVPESEEIGIIEAAEAPPLQGAVVELIGRVNNLDADEIRLAMKPDHRLGSRRAVRNFGQEMLVRVKNMFGISTLRHRWKQTQQWREFRQKRKKEFRIRPADPDSIN